MPESLTGIIEGEFGKTITLTLKNAAGTAQDISSFTTRTVEFRKPRGAGVGLTKTATFTTDGINGKLDVSFASGDVTEEGLWKGQVRLEKTGEETRSEIFEMPVGEQI